MSDPTIIDDFTIVDEDGEEVNIFDPNFTGYSEGSSHPHTHYCTRCDDNWWCEVEGCEETPATCPMHDESMD